MSLVADSISIAMARTRSRRPPDSSSWHLKLSNCFSTEEEVPSSAIEEEWEVAESKRNALFLNGKGEGGRMMDENVRRVGRKIEEWGLGFKERDTAEKTFRNTAFILRGLEFWYCACPNVDLSKWLVSIQLLACCHITSKTCFLNLPFPIYLLLFYFVFKNYNYKLIIFL